VGPSCRTGSPALFTACEEWQDDDRGELVLVRDEWQLRVGSPEAADAGDADPAIAGYVTLLVNRCGGAAIDVETGDGLSAPYLPMKDACSWRRQGVGVQGDAQLL
jgi:hypothetical protein